MYLAETSSALFAYGLVVRFRLLSTPPLDDAVTFSYRQPVLLPEVDFHYSVVVRFQAQRAAPVRRGSASVRVVKVS